jgi:hypothetical protein
MCIYVAYFDPLHPSISVLSFQKFMLSEVSQKHKGHVISLIHGREIQKINIYTKINTIIYKYVVVDLFYGTQEKRKRKRE